MKNKLLILTLVSSLFLSGCDGSYIQFNKVSGSSELIEDDITTSLYSEEEYLVVDKEFEEVKSRFKHVLDKYSDTVNGLWETEGFYRNQERNLSPKEALIDFYLFMEYHRDTQLRNLSFPSVIRDELMLIEIMFVEKAITYVESLDLGDDYEVLKQDLLNHSKKLYREELINILYEGLNQVDLSVRIPNILDRSKESFINNGLMGKIKFHLGIPESIISRGMGLDLVTLYSGLDDFEEHDVKKLAMILTVEMKISGANMRLEKFFNVAGSIDGLSTELEELKKDIELLNLSGELSWVKDRMENSVMYLEKINSFYSEDKKEIELNDIFIELKVREDFYGLGLLNKNLKEVMDNEDYWYELENVKEEIKINRLKVK